MSDLEYVIDVTTKLESRLRNELGAIGKGQGGLFHLFEEVQQYFPDRVAAGDRARSISTVRNQFAHERRKYIDDPVAFRSWVRGFNQDISKAESIRNSRPANSACSVVVVVALTLPCVVGAALAWMI